MSGFSVKRNGHIPVLLKEVIENLNPCPGKIFVDGTIGGGGHAREILKRIIPGGRLIGIDVDDGTLEVTARNLRDLSEGLILIKGNYSDLREILQGLGIEGVDGILLDLGVSSIQLKSGRGFSFNDIGPLDMRMDVSKEMKASDVVNRFPENKLAGIIWEYGEEKRAKKIARAIVRARPIKIPRDLARLITKLFPKGSKRIHPATKTFQALRICVNDELNSLRRALKDGSQLLRKGGRFCVISFHSLEDRVVKDSFKQSEGLRVLTKKPLIPGIEEVRRNPRARSAKLRVAEAI
jgi:16S rRNA (cytosine1402-N4)-methyltransferase